MKSALDVPVVGVVSDGQRSIRFMGRNGTARRGTWLVSFSRFSRKPRKRSCVADRHAKKELKKRVRGVRAIERAVTDAAESTTEVVQG